MKYLIFDMIMLIFYLLLQCSVTFCHISMQEKHNNNNNKTYFRKNDAKSLKVRCYWNPLGQLNVLPVI